MQSYTVGYDFGGNPSLIDEAQLKQEITNSSISKICHNVGIEGNQIRIVFDGRLTAGEKVTLDGLVRNHVPIPKPQTSYATINPTNNLIQHRIGDLLRTFMSLQPNEVYISKSGQAQYTSIKAAVLANPSPNMIYVVYPADYYEDNPIILPRGSSLRGMGTPDNTKIIANNPNLDIITFGRGSLIANVSLNGARGARGLYFDCSQSGGLGEFGIMIMVFINDCAIGIEADGKNMSANWIPDILYVDKVVIRAVSQPGSRGLSVVQGGVAVATTVQIKGVMPGAGYPFGIPYANAIYCSGARSSITTVAAGLWFSQVACYIDDGATAQLTLTKMMYNAIGLQVGPTGTSCVFLGTGIDFVGTTVYNIDIQAVDAKIDFSTGVFEDKSIRNPNNVSINIQYNATKFGKFLQSHLGDFQFGTVVAPSKVSFGEGQYAVDGVYVFANTHLEEGLWTDNTYGSQTLDAPPFYIFTGTNAGNCIYLGSDVVTPGFKIDVTVPISEDALTTDIAWEYWTGVEWKRFAVMQSYATKPCYSTLKSFISIQDKFHVRFGLKSNTDIPLKTINGRSKKWIRGRLLRDIDRSPQAEYLKFHTNSQIINADGFSEFFGDSRLIISTLSNFEIAYSSDNAPLNQKLFISKDLDVNLMKNLFKAGVKARQGMRGIIPNNVDTSFPLQIKIAFAGSSGVPGNVHWKFQYSISSEGSPVYFNSADVPDSSDTDTEGDVISPIERANLDHRATLSLDIQRVDINPTDGKSHIIWMSLERDASGADVLDTYQGDVAVILFKCVYVTWNNGSHLLGF